MTAVRLVAWAVFRESVRDRVPATIVAFAALLMAGSFLVGQLTAGQDLKIIKDLGLAALSLFGLAIAIVIGIGLVSKEIERRSIYALLAKPLTRDALLAGKYAGLLLTLAVNVGAMTVMFFIVLAVMRRVLPASVVTAAEAPAVDPRLLIAVVMIFGELAIVTALALFFSTFSGPWMSALFTVGLWVAGHFTADLRSFGTVVDQPAAAAVARIVSYALPDLSSFDVKAAVVHGQAVAAGYVVWTLVYAALYVAAVLLLAMVVFRRRDFK